MSAGFSGQVQEVIEAELNALLAGLPQGRLAECARYALLPTGKLLRPQFFAAIVADHGMEWTQFASVGAAIEALHVASLIHDDLPCLDNDDLRRGRPSSHRQFSEAVALLTGDSLPCIAIERIGKANLNPEVALALMCELLRAYREVCHGQVLDLDRVSNSQRDVARAKTGALFGAVFRCAGICAQVSDDACQNLEELGAIFGVLFQLEDDFGDIKQDKDRGADTDLLSRKELKECWKNFREDVLEYKTSQGFVLVHTTRLIKSFLDSSISNLLNAANSN